MWLYSSIYFILVLFIMWEIEVKKHDSVETMYKNVFNIISW